MKGFLKGLSAVLALTTFLAANEFADLYRSGGLSAMEQRANEILSSSEYWQQKLENLDTRFGYFEEPRKHLFVVDKSAQIFALYDYQGGRLLHEGDYNATLGDAHGDKFVEGDLKTPVGTYRITGRLSQKTHKLDSYYGPLAFTTNYPNYHDRKLKKTGHGIWVHGFPLNGHRDNNNSEGCVVVDNELLLELDKRVNSEDIVVMINEEGRLEADKNDLADILALLFRWRWTWKTNDLENYLSLYSKDFTRHDGLKREKFDIMKRQIFSRNEQKIIDFSDIEVVPYPNSVGQTLYRVRYWQDYTAPSHVSSRTKELYVRKEGGRFVIILEH